MTINPKDLLPYFTGKKKHAAYHKTVEIYNALRIHANGEKPDKLLNDYRPSESKEIFDYRLKIYEPVTKEHISQIITSLSKIRRSSDWSIKYGTDIPPVINASETPEQYCEQKFPFFGSLTNWVFSVLLKNYLVDPNAVLLLLPLKTEVEASEYLQPFPIIFNSDQVIEFIDGELAILKSKEKVPYQSGNNTRYDGAVYYVIDNENIYRFEQSQKEFVLASEFPHRLGRLPVIRVKGNFFETYDRFVVYESRISPIIPRLNKVVREDSDLDAAKVAHLYPEAWEYATQPCPDCFDAGTGQCTGQVKVNKRLVSCSTCSGTGKVANSGPYKKYVVRPTNQNMGETPVPTPPKGYIHKPVEIVQLQDQIIDKNAYKALASINMQFLLQSPMNQSGYAKEVDRDELNNFVYAVAEDLVRIMDECYWFIINYRYQTIVPQPADRDKLLPEVKVPEKFDILSLSYLEDEITTAIEKKMNPVILQAMLVEFINKKFYNQPALRNMLSCSLQLDPMPCASDEEKVLRKQNGGVTEKDYIISCKLISFITRAVNEYAAKQQSFYDLDMKGQLEIIGAYAEEVLKENTPST